MVTTTAVLAAVAPSAVLGQAAAQAAEPGPACPATEVPASAFADVAAGDVHAASVDCAVWWGLARGVDGSRFAPGAVVTRGQAASVMARAVRRTGGQLAASPGDRLAGDEHSVHHYAINRLAAAGVLAGEGGRSRPDAPVTRAQLASVLVRTFEHRTGTRLPAGPDAFHDDDGSVHEASIDKAAAAGLAAGVPGVGFLPDRPVTRAQTATFVSRMLQAVVDTGQVVASPATLRRASALTTDEDCEQLLGHLKERGVEEVGPYGWTGGFHGGPVPVPALPGTDDSAGGEAGGGAAAPGAAPAPAHSGTNVQEPGVDEADAVKTDGRTLWSVLDGRLRAVDVSGSSPRELPPLELPGVWAGELLVADGRALVLGTAHDVPHSEDGEVAAASTLPGPGRSSTVLTWVDVRDPAAMRVEGHLRVDGAVLAARMVDGVARVAVRSEAPDLGFTHPAAETEQAHQEAAQANRLAVERSTVEQWLPRYRLEDLRSGQPVTTEGALYGCASLHRPPEYSGLGALSVLTSDLAAGPQAGRSTGVLAGGDLLYASKDTVYVATQRWFDGAPERIDTSTVTTEVHAFSLADRTTAAYAASGKVEGFLLDQFAMSEHAGHLRVASTSRPLWLPGEESDSAVTVLAHSGSTLVPVGRVGGLGRGEEIRSVRFLGDRGYVVTFRQTDPLYSLDLSDPARPVVTGELKILGYSAYLHPAGEDLLIGVGQDADADGRQRGTQVSLFDVSDPAAPRRLHALALGEGTSSEVEHDHRAFLHWPATGTTVLPFSRYSPDPETQEVSTYVGALGLDVDREGIRELARIDHGAPDGEPGEDGRWPGIRRTVVVGDVVYTVSERGMEGSDLVTLAERSWLAFRR